MAIDSISVSSSARDELLAMIRMSQQPSSAAPERKAQHTSPALGSPPAAITEPPIPVAGRMPVRRISIYV